MIRFFLYLIAAWVTIIVATIFLTIFFADLNMHFGDLAQSILSVTIFLYFFNKINKKPRYRNLF